MSELNQEALSQAHIAIAVLETTLPMPDVVDQPPQLTTVQITKLADFFKTNPDIAEAFGL